ncbi:hypothetical protein IWQ60_005892 [Tieghemiomyces parasiticus]|uniref:Uncharacterized protein n=1 Tax=Tieghemiomyces parasiticus TaxID=78921 RepID=A0A9W8A626_9FUNG|nr:hypothetical protein IWQ60_005892 [Tieghemiomyces parasiticus]
MDDYNSQRRKRLERVEAMKRRVFEHDSPTPTSATVDPVRHITSRIPSTNFDTTPNARPILKPRTESDPPARDAPTRDPVARLGRPGSGVPATQPDRPYNLRPRGRSVATNPATRPNADDPPARPTGGTRRPSSPPPPATTHDDHPTTTYHEGPNASTRQPKVFRTRAFHHALQGGLNGTTHTSSPAPRMFRGAAHGAVFGKIQPPVDPMAHPTRQPGDVEGASRAVGPTSVAKPPRPMTYHGGSSNARFGEPHSITPVRPPPTAEPEFEPEQPTPAAIRPNQNPQKALLLSTLMEQATPDSTPQRLADPPATAHCPSNPNNTAALQQTPAPPTADTLRTAAHVVTSATLTRQHIEEKRKKRELLLQKRLLREGKLDTLGHVADKVDMSPCPVETRKRNRSPAPSPSGPAPAPRYRVGVPSGLTPAPAADPAVDQLARRVGAHLHLGAPPHSSSSLRRAVPLPTQQQPQPQPRPAAGTLGPASYRPGIPNGERGGGVGVVRRDSAADLRAPDAPKGFGPNPGDHPAFPTDPVYLHQRRHPQAQPDLPCPDFFDEGMSFLDEPSKDFFERSTMLDLLDPLPTRMNPTDYDKQIYYNYVKRTNAQVARKQAPRLIDPPDLSMELHEGPSIDMDQYGYLDFITNLPPGVPTPPEVEEASGTGRLGPTGAEQDRPDLASPSRPSPTVRSPVASPPAQIIPAHLTGMTNHQSSDRAETETAADHARDTTASHTLTVRQRSALNLLSRATARSSTSADPKPSPFGSLGRSGRFDISESRRREMESVKARLSGPLTPLTKVSGTYRLTSQSMTSSSLSATVAAAATDAPRRSASRARLPLPPFECLNGPASQLDGDKVTRLKEENEALLQRCREYEKAIGNMAGSGSRS